MVALGVVKVVAVWEVEMEAERAVAEKAEVRAVEAPAEVTAEGMETVVMVVETAVEELAEAWVVGKAVEELVEDKVAVGPGAARVAEATAREGLD